jgi:hypothetical protein
VWMDGSTIGTISMYNPELCLIGSYYDAEREKCVEYNAQRFNFEFL